MSYFLSKVLAEVKRENGQGVVEYIFLLALLSLALIGGLTLLGSEIEAFYQNAISKL